MSDGQPDKNKDSRSSEASISSAANDYMGMSLESVTPQPAFTNSSTKNIVLASKIQNNMQVKSTLRQVTGANDVLNEVATNGTYNNVKRSAEPDPEEEVQTLKKVVEQQQSIIAKLQQQLTTLMEEMTLQNQTAGKGSAQPLVTAAVEEVEAAPKWAQTLIAAMQHINNRLDANEREIKELKETSKPRTYAMAAAQEQPRQPSANSTSNQAPNHTQLVMRREPGRKAVSDEELEAWMSRGQQDRSGIPLAQRHATLYYKNVAATSPGAVRDYLTKMGIRPAAVGDITFVARNIVQLVVYKDNLKEVLDGFAKFDKFEELTDFNPMADVISEEMEDGDVQSAVRASPKERFLNRANRSLRNAKAIKNKGLVAYFDSMIHAAQTKPDQIPAHLKPSWVEIVKKEYQNGPIGAPDPESDRRR